MHRTSRAIAALVLAAAFIASVACDWPWLHDMANQPSPAAGQGPRPPAERTVPLAERGPTDRVAGEAIVSPVPADPATIENGRALYGIYCVPCHGPTGSAIDASVAKYFPRVGDLRSADVQRHGDGWFYAVISFGTADMPAFGHELDPHERWQIVRFVRTLAR
jgi:mono/diheme cytochrome c family protein